MKQLKLKKSTTLIMGLFTACLFSPSIWAVSDSPTTTDNNIIFNTPAFSLNTEYSSQYGLFNQAQYANTFSLKDAAAILLGFGSEQFRLGLTWAHQLTENQRVKLGIEHLGQDNTFQFTTGSDHEFVGQNAMGADYQYLMPQQLMNALEVSGYYAISNDSNFSPKTFSSNGQNYIDYRDVTGADISGLGLGPDFKLGPNTELGTQLNYDDLHYSSHYEPANNKAGFGATMTLAQQLNQTMVLNLLTSYRQPYEYYQAGLDWQTHRFTKNPLNWGVYISHLHSNVLLFSNENIIGLHLAYSWGSNAATVANTTIGDLLNWTSASPAYVPSVFVMRDEAVVAQ